MILADKGIVPLEEWEHKPEIKNKKGKTVSYLL